MCGADVIGSMFSVVYVCHACECYGREATEVKSEGTDAGCRCGCPDASMSTELPYNAILDCGALTTCVPSVFGGCRANTDHHWSCVDIWNCLGCSSDDHWCVSDVVGPEAAEETDASLNIVLLTVPVYSAVLCTAALTTDPGTGCPPPKCLASCHSI